MYVDGTPGTYTEHFMLHNGQVRQRGDAQEIL